MLEREIEAADLVVGEVVVGGLGLEHRFVRSDAHR